MKSLYAVVVCLHHGAFCLTIFLFALTQHFRFTLLFTLMVVKSYFFLSLDSQVDNFCIGFRVAEDQSNSLREVIGLDVSLLP